MRISDWSSDVCSSDLGVAAGPFREIVGALEDPGAGGGRLLQRRAFRENRPGVAAVLGQRADIGRRFGNAGEGRELRSEESRVGRRVSVSVDIGGRRIIKKKKKHTEQTYT